MRTPSLNEIRIHPEALAALHRRARHARSVAVHSLLARLVHRLAPRTSALDLFARIA